MRLCFDHAPTPGSIPHGQGTGSGEAGAEKAGGWQTPYASLPLTSGIHTSRPEETAFSGIRRQELALTVSPPPGARSPLPCHAAV